MKLPLQIVYRDVVPLPSLEPEIRRLAAKLDQWTPDVMSCHVAVESTANRRHQGHPYSVKVSVRVPDAEIVASTHHTDQEIQRAVHGAFDAVGRQLEDYARERRGQVKQHHAVIHGHIVSLSDDGIGRIVSDAGDEYHFDRTQVAHPSFEQLAVDQEVRFLEGITRAGREARRIAAAQ
jgi:ribosome-associated translation inhibitor RaiA